MAVLQFPRAFEVRQKAFSVDELGLLQPDQSGSMQCITRVAQRTLRADASFVGLFEAGGERQLFASGRDLPENWADAGWFPRSGSFCQLFRQRADSLAIADKDSHALCTALEGRDGFPFRAFLGAPIFAPAGETIGSLCVFDRERRDWTEEDRAVVEDLAHCATDAIRLRAALLTSQNLRRELETTLARLRHNAALRDAIVAAFTAPDRSAEDRLQAMLKAGCASMNMAAAAVTRVEGPHTRIMVRYDSRTESPAWDGFDNTGSLTGKLLSGNEMLWFHDPASSGLADRPAFDGSKPGRFIGAPLILDGITYGTLEFIGERPERRSDMEANAQLVSVIAMFTITQLEVFSRMDRLKRSEAALLQYILDLRAEQRPSPAPD